MDSDIMEDSAFEDDFNDESDGYSPEPKKAAKAKPVAKKPAAATAATSKKMVQTKLTGAKPATKKRPKPESDDEDDEDSGTLADTPPEAKKQKTVPRKVGGGKPLADIENESVQADGGSAKKSKKPKTASEKYQKLSQHDHILIRPDTYIGSVEHVEQKMWVYNKESKAMEFRSVTFVPGLYKIFDEILVNAADNKQNNPESMSYLKVTIDREGGCITVENNGKGIDIEMHSEHKVWIPEMIFGHLLAGSNFDDTEQRTVGGRNGYGAKLCNVFSTEFTLECQDKERGKRFKQTWTDNMFKAGKPKVTSSSSADFVKVTFHPDFEKFKMEGIDDDLEALMYRRVYDMAGSIPKLKVYLNNELIKLNNFGRYCEMYAKAIAKEREDPSADDKPAAAEVIYERVNDYWEVAFAVSDGTFQQVSFVNNIATTSGGTHVNYIADQICDGLLKELNKRKKGHSLKASHMKNHIFLFINCKVANPTFNSQTKEHMTLRASQFKFKCELPDKFLKKIKQTEAIDNIMHFAEKKADKLLAKTDGGKRSRISNDKLVDANLAGTKRGHECTLILTEGDSAKGLAISGRAILDPDRIGVFPLRGKMLNVRDASVDQIGKNAEIQNIKQFLGLKHKQVYTEENLKTLRYGHLMIMADQDHDGSHIKGLLINFLEVQFPSLLKIPKFLQEFITPVVKVWQGSNPKKPQRLKSFFTLPEYEEWKLLHAPELRRWQYKYYKGLGTSSNEDAQVYFTNIDDHLKLFETMNHDETELLELVFSKKKADARKEWLGNFVPGTFLDHSSKQISYTDFVNRELILFSMADNIRSIPSVVDGFKPGQRKVLHACFKRNLIKDKKVVELAGYVSEQTAYHHGEVSLQQTIIGLAQNFVGSNNVNTLEPSGNFGSRLAGGSDAASARYIHTRLSPFARRVFSPLDEPILDFQFEDGKMIEPKTFAPILPMVLINGADGIGTGWSTSIPNYNPIDIIDNLKRRMGRLDPHDSEEKPFEAMMPWWRGWKGQPVTKQNEAGKYEFNGIASVDSLNPNEVIVSELPIRMWTDDFKSKLETIIRAEKSPSFIKDYKEFNDHKTVNFVIQMDEKHMENLRKSAEDKETKQIIQHKLLDALLDKFKLFKQVSTTNLVAFDTTGKIRKYNSPEEILEEFYSYRLNMYAERKSHWLKVYDADLRKLQNQRRFIMEIIDGKLVVSKKKKAVLVEELRRRKYEAFPPKAERKAKSTDEELDQEDQPDNQEEEEEADTSARDYDYLLSMPIWSLTMERIERLNKLIHDKKVEYDELEALSEKDLWCKDLDGFVEEWENQMRIDAEIQTNIRKMGRRVSKKLGAGGGGKGRRPKADDDYDPGAKKTSKAAVKPAAKPAKVKERIIQETTQNRFKNMFNRSPQVKPETKIRSTGLDGADDDLSDDDFSLLGKLPSKKPEATPVSSAPEAAGGRKRAAAAKKTYVIDSDSDGDVFLNIGKSEQRSKEPSAVPSATPSYVDNVEELEEQPVVKKSASLQVVERSAKRPAAAKAKHKYNDDLDDSENDDQDFEELEEKPAVKKSAPPKRAAAAKAKPKYTNDLDDSENDDQDFEEPEEKPAVKKLAAPKRAAAAKAKPIYADDLDESKDDVEDIEELEEKPVAKKSAAERPTKRAAAAKAKPKYADDSEESENDDDDDDDDEDLLGDVGALVKGIGGSGSTSSKGATAAGSNGRLSLFAMSRPDNAGGSQDLSRMLKTKASKSTFDDLDDYDDTNYEALAVSSPRKSTATKNDNDDLGDFLSDDDDLPPIKKTVAKASASSATSSAPLRGGGLSTSTTAPAKKARGRPAGAKNKAKEAPVKPAPAPAPAAKPKAQHLSPAAKAYAAKKAKAAKRVLSDDEDEDEDVAMEDAPSPEPAPKARGRPGRAAAAKKPIIIDDDDEDEDDSLALPDDGDGDSEEYDMESD